MSKAFQHFSTLAAHATGSVWSFALALLVVCMWAITGPVFGFSNTWQLVINTGTTIITFLMVFLIQSTQNRDSAALHAKLDELILHVSGARNQLVDAEAMSDEELQELKESYHRMAQELAETQEEREEREERQRETAL